MDLNAIKCNIHNKFDIEVIDGKTGEIKEKAEAYNMVLDNLWHYIIETTTAFGNAIQYGSGTGTISASDTSLFNRVNGINVTQDSLDCDYANKVITRRCHINLGLTTSVGINITEVGLAAGTGNGTLTTHAMLQDMNGNPISIAKTEFDIINIYATIYCHWSIANSATQVYPSSNLQSLLTGGTAPFRYDGERRKFGVGFGNGYQINTKVTNITSNIQNKTITFTIPRYTQSEGNIASGIGYILGYNYLSGIAIKQGVNTWSNFNITNEAVGTGDGTTTKFKTKFSHPINVSLYINGILQDSNSYQILPINFSNIGNIWPLVCIDRNLSTDNNLVYAPHGSTDWYGITANKTYFNPYYAVLDFASFRETAKNNNTSSGLHMEFSNDLITWETVEWGSAYGSSSSLQTRVIPEQYRHYKYFYLQPKDQYATAQCVMQSSFDGYNIIFDTAPADGDVITIDYTTDCIPKDEDHVMDATVTFQFGDYTPSP